MTLLFKQIEQYMQLSAEDLMYLPVETLNTFMRTLKLQSNSDEFLKRFIQNYQDEEKTAFGKMLLFIECIIEKRSVTDYIEGKVDIINEKIKRCTPHMLLETRNMNLTTESHVLLVGAGAMPLSAAVLQRQYQCQVTCLDIDEQAIELARRWLNIIGNIDSIHFLQKDIFNLSNFDCYSHIVITGHIPNKDLLLKHLSPLLTTQIVLLRNSLGLYQYVYSCATVFKGYEIIDLVDHQGQMPYSSIVLKNMAEDCIINTPCYYFNLSTIRRNYLHIRSLLKDCDKVFYALKANGEKTIIQSMMQYSVPFEVSSLGEYYAVKSIGVSETEIICSLPIKSVDLVETLYSNGCRYFVFDNWEEYKKLQKHAPQAKKLIRLDITDISENTIDYGMKVEVFLQEYQQSGASVDGVTFYNIPNLSKDVLTKILNRCKSVLHILTNRPRILNIGGNYRFETDLEPGFYDELHNNLSSLKANMPDLVTYAEPGRTVVKSAGMIFTSVISIDRSKNPFEVYIDAGIPTGILYPPRKVGLCNVERMLCVDSISYRFYATTCSKRLLFSAVLPYTLQENDMLVLEEMGTYSLCKANHFHGWELPQAVYYSEGLET